MIEFIFVKIVNLIKLSKNWLVVRNQGSALEYVKDQTPAICLAAVQQDGHALQFVKKQTPAICLAAVKNNGLALEHVKQQTHDKVDPSGDYLLLDSNLPRPSNPEQKVNHRKARETPLANKPFYDLGWRDGDLGRICFAAVQQNGGALEYVKEQTPEICLAAVQQNGMALQFVKEQTQTICLAAVQEYGYALQFVKYQTPEICLAAVQQDGWALQFIEEQTPTICLSAIQKHGHALQYVKDLYSIALLIDQQILDRILMYHDDYNQETIEKAKVIIKIRATNEIVKRINEVISPSVNRVNKKARL